MLAFLNNCHVKIIENDQRNRITSFYVTFKPNGEQIIGNVIENLLTANIEFIE